MQLPSLENKDTQRESTGVGGVRGVCGSIVKKDSLLSSTRQRDGRRDESEKNGQERLPNMMKKGRGRTRSGRSSTKSRMDRTKPLHSATMLPGVIDLGCPKLTKQGRMVALQRLNGDQAKYNGHKALISKQRQETGVLRVTLVGVHHSLLVLPRNLKEIVKANKDGFDMDQLAAVKKAAATIGKRAASRAMNGISISCIRNLLRRFKNSTMCLNPSLGAQIEVTSGDLKGVLGRVVRCVKRHKEYEIEYTAIDPWSEVLLTHFREVEISQLKYVFGLTHNEVMMCQCRDVVYAITADIDGERKESCGGMSMVSKLESEGHNSGIGKATVLVSFPENCPIKKLLGVLEDFVAANRLPKRTLFWIDCLSSSVHSRVGAEEMGRLARRMAHTLAIVSMVRKPPPAKTHEEMEVGARLNVQMLESSDKVSTCAHCAH
jgi:hypothetical protein